MRTSELKELRLNLMELMQAVLRPPCSNCEAENAAGASLVSQKGIINNRRAPGKLEHYWLRHDHVVSRRYEHAKIDEPHPTWCP